MNGRAFPYIQTITTQQGNAPAVVVYQVDSTDTYGNPVNVTDHGVPLRLEWNRQGQCMIRKTIGSYSPDETTLPTSDYEYDAALRLHSSEEAGQPKLYYEYDFMGRLIGVYQLINSFSLQGGTRRYLRTYRYDYRLNSE